jgi:nondiscriminating glutamyl-tRNA synthetase
MEKNKDIRVRFAPSPTGYLHIGSARTALFNWLFARKAKGSFIIRIEDTDMTRHMEEAVIPILDSLKWLGIDWDEGPDKGGGYGPYRQSERTEIYRKYADSLLEEKKAYRCFCSPQSLKDSRLAAESRGKTFQYDRRCLNLSGEEIDRNLKGGMPFAIRLLVPGNKILEFDDRVYGSISVKSDTIEDFIILRSNGLPTYNFSAAIDDALMQISHVIRGEDHLSNTPKQLMIYDALQMERPIFTHLPMILGPDGKKLSKRHGSVSIEAFRQEGYLPQAIVNYISLLGWAFDEKSTIFTRDELIDRFSLEDINKKGARFDHQKLLWMNGAYIRDTDEEILTDMLLDTIREKLKNLEPSSLLKEGPEPETAVSMIVPILRERIKTIDESLDWVMPFFTAIEYSPEMESYFDKKAIDAAAVLYEMIGCLETLKDDFTSENIEGILRSLSEKLGLSFRKLAEVLRIALWAKKVSPPLFSAMEILGYDLTLDRIRNYYELIKSRQPS